MKNTIWLKLLVSLLLLSVAISMFACSDPEQETTDTSSTEATESGTDTDSETDETHETGEDISDSETSTGTSSDGEESLTYPENYIPVDGNVETKAPDDAEIDADGCHPKYETDEKVPGYHRSPACETCGKKASTWIAHTGYGSIEDEGDILVYTYSCMRCKHIIDRIEIPYDVDMYIDPMALIECGGDFEESGGKSFSSTDGIPTARFKSIKGKGRYVTVYEDANTSTPTGRYMAMKIKLRSGRTSLRLATYTIEGQKNGSLVFKALSGLNSGWASVIIDLSKIVDGERGFIPDASGEYYLHTMNLYMDGNSALATNDYFDLAFVAFCSDLQDAKELFANDNAVYMYEDLSKSSSPTILGTPCDHSYEYDTNSHWSDPCDVCKDEGGVVTHKCEVIQTRDEVNKTTSHMLECMCGYKTAPLVISDDINYFSAPGQYYNNWATVTGDSPNGSTVMIAGIVMSEGDTIFSRIGIENGASLEFTNGTLSPIVRGFGAQYQLDAARGFDGGDTISGGSGSYIVLKARCSGLNLLRVVFNDGTNEKFYSGGNKFQHVERKSAEITSGEWTTYVIDVAALNSPYYTANNKDVEHVAFGLHFQNNGPSESEDVVEYIDIAYFAVCDNWDEVTSLTGNDQVLFTNWKNPSADVLRNPDGSCVKCGLGLISSEDNKLIYGCPACKTLSETREIPADINYYSAPGYYYNNWSSDIDGNTTCDSVGSFIMDEEGGFTYNRVKLYQGANFEFTNGSTVPDRGFAVNGLSKEDDTVIDPGNTIKNGSGKFFVLKMRSTDVEYVDIIVNGDDDDGKLMTTSSVRRSYKDISDDEWTVYVIDIEKMGAEHYKAMQTDVESICVALRVDEGHYDEVSGNGSKGTETMDIAYFAICNDWAQVASVVGDETVVYTDWKTPANDELRNSDGTTTCQHESWGDYESDATSHWQDACTECQEAIAAKPHNWKYKLKARVCYTCGKTETCDKNHYEFDENGHKVNESCDVCQVTAQEQPVEHEWTYGTKSRQCEACKYSETCTEDHYVSDKNGHRVTGSCDICQLTKQDKAVEHDWKYGTKSRECKACAYVETCNKNHYTSTDSGHKIKEDCAICQLTKQNEEVAHNETPKAYIIKGTETTKYYLGCSACGHELTKYSQYTQNISNKVNYYSFPGLQTNNYNAGGPSIVQGGYIPNIQEETVSGKTFIYNRITFNVSGSIKFNNGTSDAGRMLMLEDTIGGSGKYAVMKIRVGGESIGWLSFGSWDGSGNPASADNIFRRDNSPNLRGTAHFQMGEWVTYVINLEKIDTTYYKANNAELTNASFGFQIKPGSGGTETDYIDIAYFAICDDLTEVGYVVGDDTVGYLEYWSGSAAVTMTCHKGEHTFATGSNICSVCKYERVCTDVDGHYEITQAGHKIIEDCEICQVTVQTEVKAHTPEITFTRGTASTEYKYVCSACGYEMDSWSISNDINFYSAPGHQTNNWNAGGVTKGEYINSLDTYTNETTGESFIYNRIVFSTSGSMKLVNGTGGASHFLKLNDTISGSGKYAVMKIRIGGTSIGNLSLGAWDGSGSPASANNVFGVSGGANVRSTTMLTTGEWITYVVDLASLDSAYYTAENDDLASAAFGLKIQDSKGGTSTDYIDIAYFAVCDDWDEVAYLVSDDAIKFIGTWKNGSSVNSSCHLGVHLYDQTTKTCTVCGETTTADLTTNKTFTEEINLYSAPGTINTNHSWSCSSNMGVVSYDDVTGDIFQRITVKNAGGTIPLTAFGNPFDSTNNTTGASGTDGYTDGAGQALAGGSGKYFVLRMRTNVKEALSWRIATADSTGLITHTGSYKASRPDSDITKGEWVTYVIDIAKMTASAGITTYSNADASAGAFCMQYGNGNTSGERSGEYLDIAYFAVVDSWTEVADITGSSAQVLYTNWDNTSDDAVVTVSAKVTEENAG